MTVCICVCGVFFVQGYSGFFVGPQGEFVGKTGSSAHGDAKKQKFGKTERK